MRYIEGIEYRRYYASVVTNATGRPTVAVGRLGKNEYDAREDAAALLLRRVMASTGKKIRDHNHYNVEVLEEQLNKTIDENLELQMEISILNEEIRMMTVNGGRGYRLYAALMENFDDNQDEEMSSGAQSKSPQHPFPSRSDNTFSHGSLVVMWHLFFYLIFFKQK